jgi:hypothetical protein
MPTKAGMLLTQDVMEKYSREDLHNPNVQARLSQHPAQMYAKQEGVLLAYRTCGTVQESCRIAGIDRWSHQHWLQEDALWYRERFQDAVEDFADSLEALAVDRVRHPANKTGGDILLIALLNAHKPNKYRPQQSINISVEESRQSWAALRTAVRQASEPPALPAPAPAETPAATTKSEDN